MMRVAPGQEISAAEINRLIELARQGKFGNSQPLSGAVTYGHNTTDHDLLPGEIAAVATPAAMDVHPLRLLHEPPTLKLRVPEHPADCVWYAVAREHIVSGGCGEIVIDGIAVVRMLTAEYYGDNRLQSYCMARIPTDAYTPWWYLVRVAAGGSVIVQLDDEEQPEGWRWAVILMGIPYIPLVHKIVRIESGYAVCRAVTSLGDMVGDEISFPIL